MFSIRDLAAASLSQFNPGTWTVTMHELPFGLQPDGTVNAVRRRRPKRSFARR